MQSGVLENANPTILAAAQLPSRQRRRGPRHDSLQAKYDGLLRVVDIAATSFYPGTDSSDSGSENGDVDGELIEEPIDEQEIYDLISTISDPEHPHTLGQLSVVNLPDIHLSPPPSQTRDRNALVQVLVNLTPTINHCSLATVIGLAARVRLEQVLPPNYRIDVRIKEGSHDQDDQVNKQLSDKERVAAALENDSLKGVVSTMLKTCA